MSNALVLYDVQAPAAIITLNRTDRRNAMSRELITALQSAFERAGDDTAVRCVILTGAGTVFCSGMDLAELSESLNQGQGESPVWNDALHVAQLFDLIFKLPKPTIAAINGTAVAGGCGLVTVCDLAVAVPEARFGYPEVRRGLVAAIVMPHLLRHVGERAARYLLLTGELLTAEQAVQCGLINEVQPVASLLERARQWALSLAEGGPDALRRTKELIQRFSHQSVSVEEAAQASAAPRFTEECQQGLRAFFDKKPAPWATS
jgi:methylglutaconyl-CoA hydratase